MEKNRRFYLGIILCSSITLHACGGNEDKQVQQTTSGISTNTAESKQVKSDNTDKTPWSGQAQGYVSTGDPATDNVAFLVHAGQISAALNSYRDAGQRLMSLAQNNSATPEAREL